MPRRTKRVTLECSGAVTGKTWFAAPAGQVERATGAAPTYPRATRPPAWRRSIIAGPAPASRARPPQLHYGPAVQDSRHALASRPEFDLAPGAGAGRHHSKPGWYPDPDGWPESIPG